LEKTRVLIIANGFYPEQSPRAFRATELAKEFCRQGHHVSVMAPSRESIQPLLTEYPIEFISLGKLKWKIPINQNLGKVGALYNKAANRLLPLLFEYPKIELYYKVKKKLREENGKFDILISIAVPYPIHWGVAASWSTKKDKNIAPIWIADCGDPYCIQENDTFQPPFYFRWIEKWFMRKVDYISVPTETSYRGYFPEFHSKLKVIPQGFRFEDIDRREGVNDGIVRFGYGGSFAPKRRDPGALLEFLTNLDNSFLFEFHIFTKNASFVERYALKDSRIILHPAIPRIQFLETLSTFDFVVNLANFGTAQTPSKLIDYSIINKPVLQIDPGHLETEIILQFLNGNYKNQINIDRPEQYRINNVVNQFLVLRES